MSDKNIRAQAHETRARSVDAHAVKIRTEGRGFGFLKTLLVGLIIIAQLVFVILIYLGILNAISWYAIVAIVLSLICCLHVLSTHKAGQTKAVWVMFLLIFSSFGYIAYVLSSEDIFFAKNKKRYKKIFARTAQYNGDGVLPESLPLAVKRDAEFLFSSGKFKTYFNSRLKYYPSGARLFDEVLTALEGAKKFIFIEYFIISDGKLLNAITDILLRKVQEGVDVRIICDGMGSHGTISFKTKRKLRKGGVKLRTFNPILPHFSFALNIRDHRKIISVDGVCAFTGGCNLADEYINAKRMYGYWKDTGLKIEGEAVDGLTLTFLRQWELLTRKEEDYSQFFNRYEKTESSSAVVPYADGKDYAVPIGKSVYENVISSSLKKLYIMTPYFVPDEQTFNMICTKAMAGVDVRLILPGVPDKAYVYAVTKDYAERLALSGVKVYIMRHAFVHSKVMLSENCVALGSVNIDLRSYYNQFENGVYTDDLNVREEVEADFEKTFKACNLIESVKVRKNIFKRMTAGVMRLFAPLM
ncbi:MAG: hypothetical protein HDQ88_10735 [Clostridia bacterium]|nr:hypothetical protein [Clostridia bacterium]